jgi:hypothetical protein
MQYMLMCCFDEEAWAQMPEARKLAIMQETAEFIRAIVKSGQFRGSARLQPTATTTTVRERNGKLITTDGPFAETREQLGGYYLVECRDLDEALSIAGRIPSLRAGGAIEVRPVLSQSPW